MLAAQSATDLSVDAFMGDYESRRRLLRLTLSCLLAAETKTPFPEVYRTTLIQEKEQLLELLEGQLKDLKGLRTPQHILEEKAQDVRIVTATLKRLKNRSATRVMADLKQNLQAEVAQNAIDVSVRFVERSAVYDYLYTAPGRKNIKRLLEE